MIITRLLALICIAVFLAGVTACGSKERTGTPRSAAGLYEAAQFEMNRGNYLGAAELYERLEARHPFSRESQHGQVELIYAYYRAAYPDQALAASDRLLREQPRHPDLDYVHYLRGLISFDGALNIIDRAFRVDAAKRDQAEVRRAFQSFNTLVTNHPDSRYGADARQRMIHLRNQLARHEIHVARHYMELGAWVATASRARQVVDEYPETPSVVEALVILHNAYFVMEMDDLASDVARIVSLNYPEAARHLYR